MIEDAGNRSASVSANFFSSVNTTWVKGILNIGQQFLSVGGRHVQVNDTLDHDG